MSDRCANNGWIRDLVKVRNYGSISSPRGKETRELIGFQSEVVDMNFPIVTSPARKLGYRFMAAEAAWILSGDDRVSTIAPFSREISKFSDDGVKFSGAYGPKIFAQVQYVVATLCRDADSRQAVINIWRENPGPSKDIPCTLSTQFLIRDGKLHCVDNMRSSDLWLGHPYDVFNFSMLSLAVVVALRREGVDVRLGDLYLNAGSKHIYEKDSDGVNQVLDEWGQSTGPRVDPDKFSTPDEVIDHLWLMAVVNGKILEQSSWDA